MSDFLAASGSRWTRRDVLSRSVAAAAFCQLNCEGSAQQVEGPRIVKALDDANVVHGKVTFKSGQDEIDAYQSRPRKEGLYPVVIVVTGSSLSDEYIPNLTAMFAQHGMVGIAPNIFSQQKESMTPEEKKKVFVEKMTDEHIFRDLQASIDYANKQAYVKADRVGMTGFCFGGRCALMFAAKSKSIHAVVPFYGNLRTPPWANRKEDPLDVLEQIKVPVQGHYADNDAEIPAEQLKQLQEKLKSQGTSIEVFTYHAPHGFFAYNRRTYNVDAAQTSWQRTVEFFKRNLAS
jgi:carboxymethylenebutenolidase